MNMFILGIFSFLNGINTLIQYLLDEERHTFRLVCSVLYFAAGTLAVVSHLRQKDIVIDLRDTEQDDYAD